MFGDSKNMCIFYWQGICKYTQTQKKKGIMKTVNSIEQLSERIIQISLCSARTTRQKDPTHVNDSFTNSTSLLCLLCFYIPIVHMFYTYKLEINHDFVIYNMTKGSPQSHLCAT